MYSIYADDKLLYAPNLISEGYAVINPSLTFEINKAGSLSFVLPPTNPLYNSLKKLKTIITVYDEREQVFRGRILHDNRDYLNRKTVYCEGQLAFLLDTAIRPYNFTGTPSAFFRKLIAEHNEQVEEEKQFLIGNDQIGDGSSTTRTSSVYPTTWDELNNKLLSVYGGYLTFREKTIDYVSEADSVSEQVIEFGKNLLDLSEYISADSVCTVLIPLGTVREEESARASYGERTTIADVNGGDVYIENAEAIEMFGRITKVYTWDNVKDPNTLLKNARAYLAENIQEATTMTVNAVDLHLLDVNTDRIRVGQKIRVLSIPHGIDTYFLCSKIVVNMTSPDKTQYTLGASIKGVAERQAKIEQATNNAVSSAENAAVVANEAKTAIESADSNITNITDKLNVTLRIKGAVASVNVLPSANVEVGDVWIARSTGKAYAYTGSGWSEVEEDLSKYGAYTSVVAIDALEARVTALEEAEGE